MSQVFTPAADQSQLMEISMGPQHPSTHGVFRMDVRLDGERVRQLKPVFGYLHRNHEKIAESASYLAAIPYTDRLDYMCSMTNNWGYALAVEKASGHCRTGTRGISKSDRSRADPAAESRRDGGVSCCRIWALAAPRSCTRFASAKRCLDLFESLSGARMMCNYMRFGGVRVGRLRALWLSRGRPELVAGFNQLHR